MRAAVAVGNLAGVEVVLLDAKISVIIIKLWCTRLVVVCKEYYEYNILFRDLVSL